MGETAAHHSAADAKRLIHFGVGIAVGVLQAGDHLGPILHFEVSLKDSDMHLFAFNGAAAGGAGRGRLKTFLGQWRMSWHYRM
jgi:hypothetical protein